MSLPLTPEAAQAMGVGVDMAAEDLQAVIDREAAWLARRIGPLEGERTERLPLAGLRPTHHEVRLRRPTDSVEVSEAGTLLELDDTDLRDDGWRVARLPEGTHFTGPLELTYTPNDEAEVEAALIELVGLRLGTTGSGGLSGEIMGSYSYTRAKGSAASQRLGIVRGLQGPGRAGSTRLLSSVSHGLAGRVGR